ncbi:hypothetical protein IHE61_07650 [Streptomyces sp. GKU 257-1]|nr:hypothetical protein [Streptomyces sp. GKU 257-1]
MTIFLALQDFTVPLSSFGLPVKVTFLTAVTVTVALVASGPWLPKLPPMPSPITLPEFLSYRIPDVRPTFSSAPLSYAKALAAVASCVVARPPSSATVAAAEVMRERFTEEAFSPLGGRAPGQEGARARHSGPTGARAGEWINAILITQGHALDCLPGVIWVTRAVGVSP